MIIAVTDCRIELGGRLQVFLFRLLAPLIWSKTFLFIKDLAFHFMDKRLYFPLSRGSLVTFDFEKDMGLTVLPAAPAIEWGLTTLGSKVSVLSIAIPPGSSKRSRSRSCTILLSGGGRLLSSKLARLSWILGVTGVEWIVAATSR